MTHQYHSKLSHEEIIARARAMTRPWSAEDMKSRRGAWYHMVRPDGSLRLARTDEEVGVIYADISFTPALGYSADLSVWTGVPRVMSAASVVLLVFMLLIPLCNALLFPPFNISSLFTPLILLPFIWVFRRAGRGTPLLLELIEKNLLE